MEYLVGTSYKNILAINRAICYGNIVINFLSGNTGIFPISHKEVWYTAIGGKSESEHESIFLSLLEEWENMECATPEAYEYGE